MYSVIDRMSLGVIEKSTSLWSSPMRLVIKLNKLRLCPGARKINAVTKNVRLPKANIISKLDLKDAYQQIDFTEKSKEITAFTVPGRPLYQFVVMPVGLCNASQTMRRLMNEIIPSDFKDNVSVYLDDLVIVSENFDEDLVGLVSIAR